MPYSNMRRTDLLFPIVGLLVTCLAFTVRGAEGRQLPDVAPMAMSSDVWSDSDDNIWGARIGIHRTVPLGSLLPQTAIGSSIRVLILEGGVQSDDGDLIGRFRIGGLDLDVQRGHKSVLLTIADYDRAGTMDLNATWFRIGFGPGVAHDGPRAKGRFAVHAFSGLVTREFGRSLYASLPKNTRSDTMFEGGLAGRTSLSHVKGWRLDVRAEYAVHSLSGDLRTFKAEPELTWSRGPRAHVSVYTRWYGAERSSVEHHDALFGLKLRFIP